MSTYGNDDRDNARRRASRTPDMTGSRSTGSQGAGRPSSQGSRNTNTSRAGTSSGYNSNGSHPNGSHPNGYHPNGSHPNGSHPSGSSVRSYSGAAYGNRKKRKKKRSAAEKVMVALTLILLVAAIILAIVTVRVLLKRDKPKDPVTTPVPTQSSSVPAESTDTEPPATTDAPETVVPDVKFTADLSAYEQYMNPEDRDAYLTLVNPDSPLSSTYKPDDLVKIVDVRADGRTEYMRLYAEKALEALFIEARAEGVITSNTQYKLSAMSGYRSYEKQEYLFSLYTKQEMNKNPSLTKAQAEAIVVTYSCRPGTSEHQSGLCVDMHNLASASVQFANQSEAKWLAENCWKFGFILRFPEDKTEITKIQYEPWHFRYVGRYHAYKIHSAGMCLEEYVASIK